MIDNVKAKLIYRYKAIFPDGSVIEMIIWTVPTPVKGSRHPYKYRLFWGRHGTRIVGYDNERGKGDHCHLDGQELPYPFISVETLINDFYAEIDRRMPK
jgi:hypothetical protein